MKVCMVVAEFLPTMGRPPLFIAKRLIKDGHQVSIFTSDLDTIDRKLKEKVQEAEGARTHRVWSCLAFRKAIMPALLFRLLREKADVIYADGLGQFSSTVAVFAGKLKGTPVVLRADWNSTPIVGKGWKSLYDRFVKVACLKNATKILVFSEKQKAIMSGYGVAPERIEVLPNGADYEKFSAREDPHYLREKFGLDAKTKIMLSVCRITPAKNPELAIRTLALVSKRYKDLAVVIVGQKEDAEYHARLEKLAKELSLEGKVFFLFDVKHTEMPRIYGSADIFFLTSGPTEGMNISTVEAMCAGLPVMTTEVSVTPEIVEKAMCGYVIKNEEEAAGHVLEMLENGRLAKELGENGQKFARSNLTWDGLMQKAEEIIVNAGRK